MLSEYETPGQTPANFYQVAGSTFPGTYTTTIPNDQVAYFNQAMMIQVEHFDPFIQRSLIEQPSFWYNLIPRGAFPNFQGSKKETRIYRGGPVHYAGLGDWVDIDPVPRVAVGGDPAYNPCKTGNYTTMGYAYERLEWGGKKRYWGSDPVCLEQLRFVDSATEQLSWILQSGADYGVSLQEVWNRDYLLYISVALAERSFVMTSTFVGNKTASRFYYDPFVKTVTDTETKTGLENGLPFVVFEYQEVEPLNFDVLDALHESLDIRCKSAALGSNGGMGLYGLPVSHMDFERYLKGNSYEIANWRESRSESLIKGLDMGVKTHRNYSMLFDQNQFRMKILKVVGTYDPAAFGGVGADLTGKTVIVAQFVPPRIGGRTGENGQKILEDNPEYTVAELALMPVMMKDVFYNEFGTALNTLGSQTYFGPQAGLNGQWSWVNILSEDNPEGLIGNFRGKYEIWAKPSPNAVHATAFLYRRCVEPLRSRCPIENAEVNPNVVSETSPQTPTSYAVTASNAEASTLVATVLLPNKLAAAHPGQAVKVEVTGAGVLDGEPLDGYIIRAGSAPQYTIALNGVTGLVAKKPGSVVAAGYYVDANGVLQYFDADGDETPMVFAEVTLA